MYIATFLKRFTAAATLAVVLAGLNPANVSATAAAAHATPNRRTAASHLRRISGSAMAQTPATFYSNDWSGYAATGATFKQVTGSMNVPKVTCTANSAQAIFWVGLDGYADGTVEQDGIGVKCVGSNYRTPQYYAWWEMFPTNTIQTMPLKVVPGNQVAFTVTYANSKFTMKVANVTRKTSYTKTASCAAGLVCSRSSAEWIMERPTLANGSFPPLADWHSAMMYSDSAAATGALQPISAFSYTPLAMTDANGVILANVNPLSKNGKNFTDTWEAAQ